MPIFRICECSSNQTAVGTTPGDDVISGISIKIEFSSFCSWKAITVFVFPKSIARVPDNFFVISNFNESIKFFL